jgi:hypothetical protein
MDNNLLNSSEVPSEQRNFYDETCRFNHSKAVLSCDKEKGTQELQKLLNEGGPLCFDAALELGKLSDRSFIAGMRCNQFDDIREACHLYFLGTKSKFHFPEAEYLLGRALFKTGTFDDFTIWVDVGNICIPLGVGWLVCAAFDGYPVPQAFFDFNHSVQVELSDDIGKGQVTVPDGVVIDFGKAVADFQSGVLSSEFKIICGVITNPRFGCHLDKVKNAVASFESGKTPVYSVENSFLGYKYINQKIDPEALSGSKQDIDLFSKIDFKKKAIFYE